MARPVLLIAGGSRGIGASCARLAGARGYDVAVNYKSNAKAAASVVEAVKNSGGKAVALQGDMGVEADIERVFDDAARTLGPITQFIHSAGIGGKNSKLEVATAATIRDVIDVNLYGAILCARAAVRRMSIAKGGQGGSIVLISSIASVTGGAGEYVFYAAAKGGIDALTNGLAREVVKEGIRVNSVRPGPTETEIHEPGRLERITPLLPMGRPGKPNEIAEAILFLLSDAASYVTGAVLNVSGGR
jgi:NAD(P)-dependent dehydrogenase (short-subunit alcohol dehydrogenase family)